MKKIILIIRVSNIKKPLSYAFKINCRYGNALPESLTAITTVISAIVAYRAKKVQRLTAGHLGLKR